MSRLSQVHAIEHQNNLLEDLPRRKRLRNPNRKRSVRRWLRRTAKHRGPDKEPRTITLDG